MHRRDELLVERHLDRRRRRADRLEQRVAGAEEPRRLRAVAAARDDGAQPLEALGGDALVAALLRELERVGEELRRLGGVAAVRAARRGRGS